MCVEHWWNYAERGAAKYSEKKNLPQLRMLNHKSHVGRPVLNLILRGERPLGISHLL